MFATIDALATESWAPRKTLRERARFRWVLAPYRHVRLPRCKATKSSAAGRILHIGLRFERPVDGLTASLSEELICATKGT